ncbi:transcriptional regulator GlxA family with amidase domain [Nocardioides thalensis]|uniref:Transcriptional regulator GlxA family with amidase domain n=1 Tax=Nocardioides thalensis TaxID=1914755 RepID=A0A853BUW9_9ACTN|nr:helix-turn-helix domain-containing protein [Nocardioides thalensis]NYI99659.1 transcriptional regulator GlxA family with amidase domain [Nocardioides thalensis]
MRRVAVVAVPPVIPFDLAIPELIFGSALVDDAPCYEVRTCTAEPGVIEAKGSMQLVVASGLEVIADADTVIVTGTGDRVAPDPRVLAALTEAADRGARIASICTGAFVLAAAGLLDGRRATTFWVQSGALAARYPEVDVQPDVLFVEDGPVFTSAGAAAGIDLCLHLVRKDFGAAVANAAARLAVVAPVRHGGQAQFIEAPLPRESGTSLSATRAWALERLEAVLTLDDLAGHARTSVRTLTRRFQAETGMSPIQWLLHQRVERARELLESTDLPMDQVARHSGFGTADSLRRHVSSRLGLAPAVYRAAFTRLSPPGGGVLAEKT